ncbi:hypothetical protein V491_07842, partial [Pseudogymnoascus sp. VKM F-3775]
AIYGWACEWAYGVEVSIVGGRGGSLASTAYEDGIGTKGETGGVAVVRAEKAARRVIDLEGHVSELDADYESTESELNFLRLQLRALEVQGLDYVQFNDDEELTQSINNWKQQWADVEQRTKARRWKVKTEASRMSTGTGTPTPIPTPIVRSEKGLGLT